MPKRWTIKTDWALLESGSPEERAGFATLGISAYGTWLTAGHDRLLQSVREDFQVSDMTIRTLLVNYDRIDRSELDETGWAHL